MIGHSLSRKPLDHLAEKGAASSRPLLTLGLTFLLLGVGFAIPWPLASRAPAGMWNGAVSSEVLNLYALAVFSGWAHFFYAWRGQLRGSQSMSRSQQVTFWISVAMLLSLLLAARHFLGFAIFSLLVWVWNISHFAKAERFFAGSRADVRAALAPAIVFAWFSICLFRLGPTTNNSVVFAVTLLLATAVLAFGGWRNLAHAQQQTPLLTLFLLGETLVWSSYGPYMSEAFRVGVYVFHIAAASFFHYLGGYFYAESRNNLKSDRLLTSTGIVTINLLICLACLVINRTNSGAWLKPVFGLEAFTLFVALHLGASDLMPKWKSVRAA